MKMIELRLSDRAESIYVAPDAIKLMRAVNGMPKGTVITLSTGHHVTVVETPEEIAAWIEDATQ